MNSATIHFGLVLLMFAVVQANRRTCFCDIRTGTESSSPLFADVENPVYRHWFHYSCSSAKSRCPDDCRNAAARLLEGTTNPLDFDAGATACEILGRGVTPDDRVHLYAHYTTSSCGHSGYRYLGEVCCFELHVPKYDITWYLFNQSCDDGEAPDVISG